MRTVRIGTRAIGPGERCYVIAEAGSNHDGKLEQALRLIDVAADAGADAIKFQLFRAERLYPRSAGLSGYLQSDKPIYDIIAEMEMPYEWLPTLADHCRARQIEFLASAFDEESVDRLDPFVNAFKIASYEMTHLPLVRHIAKKKKPVIISTGTAYLDEVSETVAVVTETGNAWLVLMQCTAAYPAPIDTVNIRAVATLRDQFDVPVGLSDHSQHPMVAPLAAVACGAAIIEKHFTLSNALPGPDHRFALEPPQLAEMIRGIRDVEAALGNGEKQFAPVEEELRSFARRTIFTRRAIRAGEAFTADHLIVLRCGHHSPGLKPDRIASVIGRRAARDIAESTVLMDSDLV